MEITYTGKISKNDFLRAILLNSAKWRRFASAAGTVLYIGAFIFLSATSAYFREMVYSVGFGFLFPLIFVSAGWWSPYLQGMAYDQKGNIYQNNVSEVITPEKITIKGKDVEASFLWSAYIDYKLDKDMLLIYIGKNNFNIFKKSLFKSNADWENLIALATEKIALNKKR